MPAIVAFALAYINVSVGKATGGFGKLLFGIEEDILCIWFKIFFLQFVPPNYSSSEDFAGAKFAIVTE